MSGQAARGMTRGARKAIIFLFVLALLLSAANLLWTDHAVRSYAAAQQRAAAAGQRAQRHEGQVTEHKICATLEGLAKLKPPPGNPATNPSRAYLQKQHARLAQLGADIGCH